MFLRIECPGCKAVLQIEEALSGRQGKCIHCGHKIVVPRNDGTAPPRPAPQPVQFLTEASPEAMVRELGERRKSALLLVFEPAADGSYDLANVPDAKLKCIATEDVTQPRFAQLVASFGKRFAAKRPAARPPQSAASSANEDHSLIGKLGGTAPAPNEPHELKGDQLGMTLEDFKSRYARFTDDGRQDLPICSNQPGYIGKAELHGEAWHQRAKIVHARVDHPLEEKSPTIAGVKSDLMLYKFVDGRLFCIEAWFATDMFHMVSEALVEKYGPPTRENRQPREMIWENEVSLIGLTRGTVHPRVASTLHLIHKQLMSDAESRKPQGAADV
jgi:hypothetical protein